MSFGSTTERRLPIQAPQEGARIPVDSLTTVQQRRDARSAGEPSPAELARYFHRDDADLDLIAQRRVEENRLGFDVGVDLGPVVVLNGV
jgi:hypothetical protein